MTEVTDAVKERIAGAPGVGEQSAEALLFEIEQLDEYTDASDNVWMLRWASGLSGKILTAKSGDQQFAQRGLNAESRKAGKSWGYATALEQFIATIEMHAKNAVQAEEKAVEDDSADREKAKAILAAAKKRQAPKAAEAAASTEGEAK